MNNENRKHTGADAEGDSGILHPAYHLKGRSICIGYAGGAYFCQNYGG
jgi:hypothetical protein